MKLAQCRRCQNFTLLGDIAGVGLALDVQELNPQGYADALVGGNQLWWVERLQGGGQKLRGAAKAGLRPSWGENGRQSGHPALHAEHGCPATAQALVEVPKASDPCPAPVTPGGPVAGIPLPAAPAGGTGAPARPSAAKSATHPLSDHGDTWLSPTASAANSGPVTAGRTAPAATRPSAPTAPATNTASEPSASTAGVRGQPISASSGAGTNSGIPTGATRPPTHSATHLNSRPPRCGTCRKVIHIGVEMFWGIQHGHQWHYAEHESCE